MNTLEQPQVVCTIKLWYQLFFSGHFRVGEGNCIVSQKNEVCVHNWQYLVNIQSILMILAPKRNVFND